MCIIFIDGKIPILQVKGNILRKTWEARCQTG